MKTEYIYRTKRFYDGYGSFSGADRKLETFLNEQKDNMIIESVSMTQDRHDSLMILLVYKEKIK